MCQKKFRFKAIQLKHSAMMHKINESESCGKQRNCDECGKKFESKKLLFLHIKRVHEKV